ncbi:MAG: MYXO-CTERM domain-containing protein [Myxococcota bacterium]|jgi:MYXO-CTERM domain-containing protein
MVGMWILLAAAEAATLTVGPAGDYRTVSAALGEAEDGDVIEIAGGEYMGALRVDVDVTLRAADPADRPVLVARDGDLLEVSAEVTVEHVVLSPRGGRGAAIDGGDLVLRDVTITGADVEVDGGGVIVEDGSLVAEDCQFVDNRTTRRGAHISAEGAEVTLRRTAFVDGDGDFGGAVRVVSSTLIIEDSAFENNIATRDGGALYALSSEVTVSGTRFEGNSTRIDLCDDSCEGAAARFGDNSTWTVEDSAFDANTTGGDVGGAIATTANSRGTVRGSAFTGNQATFGGAIYAGSGGDLTIEGSRFDDNRAYDGEGGAIRWRPDTAEPTLRIAGSAFIGNTATDRGGALGLNTTNGSRAALVLEDNRFEANASATSGGAVSIEATNRLVGVRNLFCANTATASGGGVRVLAAGYGQSDWTNNVFQENVAGEFGGGLHLSSAGTTAFVNNHVLGNGADEGGGVRALDTDVVFVNNLVGWSTSGAGVSASGLGGALAYSALFNNAPSDLGGDLTPDVLGDGMVDTDPVLREYVLGGGCDQSIYPAEGSPLIDAGTPDLVDPDGTRSDIGAYGGPNAPEGATTDADGDGFVALEDCDDNDPTIFPGAAETCDGVDEDCDGLIDVGAADGGRFYLDVDRDGAGDPATEVLACDPPAGHVTDGTDCDDTNASVRPGAEEVCDGVDQDCNGSVDDGLLETWFADSDADGFGDSALTQDACRAPVGFVADDSDCDDADANAYPGAPDELGDDVDQDCDGEDGSLTAEGDGKGPTGCGCASDAGSGAVGWALLLLLGVRRRR